jgi:hypothetical protein
MEILNKMLSRTRTELCDFRCELQFYDPRYLYFNLLDLFCLSVTFHFSTLSSISVFILSVMTVQTTRRL